MNDNITEIRNANDIVEVISSYLPLTKKGKNYFGVCPFHDDTNPSMSVSKDKQIYKCFSCGASGNVINFVMDYENVEFKEALSILAKRAGIAFTKTNVKSQDKYEKYYQMYDLSLKLYQNNINSKLGTEAIEYLEKRKITKDLIKEFKIGLSLTDNSLTKILQSKNYTSQEMEIYGLGDGIKDLYQNRIMFPLFDTSDRPVGFSGRIYNQKTSSGKYINTKETPIFKKGENLYNYYKAKDNARIEKKLIIVEGFMDVIRLYSIGIKNVVALMGTALTKNQIKLIKRLSNNIYICLDGDSAGRHAANEIGKDLTEENLNVSVITLKENLDPDEYILKYGKEGFLALYENPLSYSEYKINYLKEGVDFTNLEEKSNYVNTILKQIKEEDDEIKQEFMLKKISKEFDIDINILKNNLKKVEKSAKIKALNEKRPQKIKLDKYKKATYNILYAILSDYECCKYYEKKLNFLPEKEERYLANEIIYAHKLKGNLSIADFITSLNDKKELQELLKEVLKNVNITEESNLEAFKDYIKVIHDYNKNQEIKRLKSLIKEESDLAKKAELLEKIRLLKIGSESND